jgi:hypothetical protein
MAASEYNDLAQHVGHRIVVVVYGGDQNAAVECEDCSMVLLDYDNYAEGANA